MLFSVSSRSKLFAEQNRTDPSYGTTVTVITGLTDVFRIGCFPVIQHTQYRLLNRKLINNWSTFNKRLVTLTSRQNNAVCCMDCRSTDVQIVCDVVLKNPAYGGANIFLLDQPFHVIIHILFLNRAESEKSVFCRGSYVTKNSGSELTPHWTHGVGSELVLFVPP